MLRPHLMLLAAPLLMVGAAQAQTAPQPLTPFQNAASPMSAFSASVSLSQANALRAAGFAKTSVEHRFDRSEVTGSLGFLCGLQPRLDEHIGAANGYDPHGRFIGAKLTRRF